MRVPEAAAAGPEVWAFSAFLPFLALGYFAGIDVTPLLTGEPVSTSQSQETVLEDNETVLLPLRF